MRLCVYVLGVVVKFSSSLNLLIVPLVLSCCKPSESIEPPEMPSEELKEVGLNEDGKEIKVSVGQDFSISLPENRTTGYQWELDAGELVHVKSDSYVGNTSKVGAGGMREYVLTADAAGESILKAVYIRPWEKGMKPTQVFEMKVRVE